MVIFVKYLVPFLYSWVYRTEDFCPGVTDGQTELSQDTQRALRPSLCLWCQVMAA